MSAPHLGPDGPSPVASAAASAVVVGVLGVIAIRRDDALVTLPGARARLLLTALAVHPGRARGAATLIDEVWGERLPRSPMNALHTQVSRLRALLPDGALEIGPAGYRLALPTEAVDLGAAAALARRADEHLGAGRTSDASASIALARALWRGEPGADLPDSGPADDLRAAAAELRRHLDHAELAALTAQGDYTAAIPLARAAALAHPLDEPAHTTLVRLLAIAGRTGDALEVFAAYRLRLITELGTDPGPTLGALNTAVLRGDPIDWPGVRPPRDTGTEPNARVASGRSAGPASTGGTVGLAGTAIENGAADSTDPALVGGADSAAGRTGAVGGGARTHSPRVVAASGAVSADESTHRDRGELRTAIGLRAAPNALLGRAADLDAIIELAHRCRVTTVLGPGGTGKTRVVNAVGERLARSVPVVLVELAPVQPETVGHDARADIEAAIGHMMGLGEGHEPGGLRPGTRLDASRRLREALAARPTVLILDNCEHVIDAVAEVVADLVGGCAQLTVLTTSRSPLAISAESVYPLAPLAVDAAGSPATELFMARARAVRPDVHLDPDAVARLCATLDGLPLAIELAAARVRMMSVAEIETRLEHRFALLRGGDRTAPHRHRTLHAVIAWSWNLLDIDQQVALRRLSRFSAGFTLSAAEIVAAGTEVDEVAAAVDGLVGQSLLTVVDDPDSAGLRYRMLETVREFGAEQLAAADVATDGAETALLRDRMARWAREFTLDAARRYRDGDQVSAVLAVTADLDNLVAVLRTAADRADARTAYSVFPVVAMVWVMRGAHLEFTGWALRLVAVAPPVPVSGETAGLQMITYLLTYLHLQFNSGTARPVAIVRMRARRLLTRTDLDPALGLLGRLITRRPDGFGLGRLLAEGARSSDQHLRIIALVTRANFWENAGNVAGATGDIRRALRAMDAAEVWGTAMGCQQLAHLCGQSARYGEAVRYYRRALELMGRLRVHDEIMESRCYLAAALIGDGQLEQARAELDFALRRDESGGLVDDLAVRRNHRIAIAATAVAELELADGDTDAGLGHYRRALDLFGWPGFEPTPGPGALMVAAATIDAYVLGGKADGAADLVSQVIETAERRVSQYVDLPQIGAVACALGSYLLTTRTGRETGLELLTLATRTAARQDSPSTELARHLALHRDTVGGAEMDAALTRIAGVRRRTAAARVVAIIAELN